MGFADMDFAMFDVDGDRRVSFEPASLRLRDAETGRYTGWYDGNGNGKGFGDNISAAIRILRALGWTVGHVQRGERKLTSPTGERKSLARRPIIRLALEEYRQATRQPVETMIDDDGNETTEPALAWEDF